jgi:hypothetical protein
VSDGPGDRLSIPADAAAGRLDPADECKVADPALGPMGSYDGVPPGTTPVSLATEP